MEYVLRDYQEECKRTVIENFLTFNRQLVQLPTGSGKTVILWHVIKELEARSLIVAPTCELVEQLEETGKSIVGDENVYRRSRSYWPVSPPAHTVMTMQAATFSLKKGLFDRLLPRILVIDEAHRSASSSLCNLIEEANKRKMFVLGMTATPERADGKSLIGPYQTLSYEKTLPDLIMDGYLCDLLCYKVKTGHKISNFLIKNGDISPVSLKELEMESRDRLIFEIFEKDPSLKTLVFCLSVEHTKHCEKYFLSRGIRGAAIYGDMPKSVRRTLLQDFKSGKLSLLFNCQLLTEGFDEPTVQRLILARPTKSKSLYFQMLGRGVRLAPGKEHCLVYDFSDEIYNLCSFNILGGEGNSLSSSWDGVSLREVIRQRRDKKDLIGGDSIVVQIEEFNLFAKEGLNGPPLEYQTSVLKELGIYLDEGITFSDAAFLIFKSRLLKNYGFDRSNYWKKWEKDLPSYDSDENG